MILRPNDLRLRMAAAQQGAWLNASSAPVPVGAEARTASVANANSLTLSNYVVPAGSNKITVVSVLGDDVANVPTLQTVTFGGVGMSQIGTTLSATVNTNFYLRGGLFYVLNPSGTNDIVTTWTTAAGVVNRITMVARTYSNVAQAAPTLFNTTNVTETAAGISTTLNSVPANSMVFDAAYGGVSNELMTTTEARQNQLSSLTAAGGNRGYAASEDLNETAGNVTFGWESTTLNDYVFWAHLTVALEQA